jgi:hypothetical protein
MLTRGVVLICILGLSLLTWGTWGEAHQSGCHRWHSCPSDTGSYVCGDLGYCSQCPDNQYCLGRQPRPAPSPPPALSLLLNQAAFTAGQTLRLTVSAMPRGAPVDVYVGLQLPSGKLFFLTPEGGLTDTPQSLMPAGLAQAASAEIFRYALTGAEPPGRYTWLGVLMAHGTTTWVSAVAQAPFTVAGSR